MPMDSLRSIRDQVIAGILIVGITAVAGLAARFLMGARWALGPFALGVVIVAVALIVGPRLARWLSARTPWTRPIARLPGPDCEIYDPGNGCRDIRWPRTRQYAHFDCVEVSLKHAAAPHDAALYANAGIEFETSKGFALCFYLSSTGYLVLHEGPGLKFIEQIQKELAPGRKCTLRLEKRGQEYSLHADDEVIWEGRNCLYEGEGASGATNLWPEQVSARVRLNTTDPNALVSVYRFDKRPRRR